MTKVIDMQNHRQPVTYTVRVTHHWNGTVETFVEDVSDDERSRNAVAEALERAAIAYRKTHPADAMHAIMLANIDMAMATTHEAPVTFTIKPDELAAWADAVQEWENVRHPIA